MKCSLVFIFGLVFFSPLSSAVSIHGFSPEISAPIWLESPLPKEIRMRHSNSHVAIVQQDGRTYLAWRSSPVLFASKKAEINIISKSDGGSTWDFEGQLKVGREINQPFFLSINGRLFLNTFVQSLGALRIERLAPGTWSEPVEAGMAGERLSEMKVRNGIAYRTSYKLGTDENGHPKNEVYFKKSMDGEHWSPVHEGTNGSIYTGGVSDVGFDFDGSGSLWALTLNDGGDSTGWGSQTATANPRALGLWKISKKSDPRRFDSPRAFEFNGEVFFVAGRDLGGNYDLGLRWLGFDLQKWIYLFRYNSTPKGTSLYWMDRENHLVKRIADLPGTGDIANPSIVRIAEDRFLIANGAKGTSLYWVELKWVPEVDSSHENNDTLFDAAL